ncbi:MAG TPA: hypothetical protein VFY92_09130 [Hyphomicrobiaceae bacterium]|nr:hypothetical protein [Hyphomicrobiaceae bacterium]
MAASNRFPALPRPPSLNAVMEGGKARLVVGLLGAAGELTAALAELRHHQLSPDRIRVIAPTHALHGALEAWPTTGAARGFGAWVVCRPAEGAIPWSLALAAGNPADPSVLQDMRALLELHHWVLRRQAERLDSHLRAGGALLLVEPGTDAEERTACTALLRHASGGVQTHEITRLRSEGAAQTGA